MPFRMMAAILIANTTGKNHHGMKHDATTIARMAIKMIPIIFSSFLKVNKTINYPGGKTPGA